MYNNAFGGNQPYPFMQPQQILQIAGAASIKTLKMAPNSSLLAMDTTAPIVWMCISDGAGTVNATAWDITLHKDPPSPEEVAAEQRLANIENAIIQLQQIIGNLSGGIQNEQPNVADAESTVAANQSRKIVYASNTGVQQPQ